MKRLRGQASLPECPYPDLRKSDFFVGYCGDSHVRILQRVIDEIFCWEAFASSWGWEAPFRVGIRGEGCSLEKAKAWAKFERYSP